MDARELQEIIKGITDELPAKLIQNKGFETLASALCRIAAYLKSEQDERIKHQKAMQQFDKMLWGDRENIDGHPGIFLQVNEIRKVQEENKLRQEKNDKKQEANRRWLLGLVAMFVFKFGYDLIVQWGHSLKP